MEGYEERLQKLRGEAAMLENFQRIVRETVEDAKVSEAEQLLDSGMLEKLVDSKTEAAEKQLFLEKLRRALQEARDAVLVLDNEDAYWFARLICLIHVIPSISR